MCLARRFVRHAHQRPGPYRPPNRLAGSYPHRAQPQSHYCLNHADGAASQLSDRCRADAGRLRVHPTHTSRQSTLSQSGWQAECAALRHLKSYRRCDQAINNLSRHCLKNLSVLRSRARCVGQSLDARLSSVSLETTSGIATGVAPQLHKSPNLVLATVVLRACLRALPVGRCVRHLCVHDAPRHADASPGTPGRFVPHGICRALRARQMNRFLSSGAQGWGSRLQRRGA